MTRRCAGVSLLTTGCASAVLLRFTESNKSRPARRTAKLLAATAITVASEGRDLTTSWHNSSACARRPAMMQVYASCVFRIASSLSTSDCFAPSSAMILRQVAVMRHATQVGHSVRMMCGCTLCEGGSAAALTNSLLEERGCGLVFLPPKQRARVVVRELVAVRACLRVEQAALDNLV